MLATVARDSPVRASALQGEFMRGPRKAFDGDDSENRTVKRGPPEALLTQELELESHSPNW